MYLVYVYIYISVSGLFACLGLTGVIPGLHYIFYEEMLKVYTVPLWLFAMALLYLIGALLYAVRIPERLSPGTFDIWVISFINSYFRQNSHPSHPHNLFFTLVICLIIYFSH